MRWLFVAMFAAMCASPAAAQTNPEVFSAYKELSLPLPNRQQIIYCHGFGCRSRTPIALGNGDRARLAGIMAAGKASPAAERKAAAAAAGWFDRRAGRMAGTSRHVARAGMRYAYDPSQLDCIDSSRNTMAVLLVLNEMKLLRYHRIDAPKARGYLVDLRPPHVTAVLTELRSGRQWSVDSWTVAAGKPAEVMPLERWLTLD